MRIRVFPLLLLLLMSFAVRSQTIVGRWLLHGLSDPKSKFEVEIFQRGDAYFGRVAKIYGLPVTENPLCKKCEGAKKNRPIIGMEVIEQMKPSGREYAGGTVTDPKSGRTYPCVLYLEPNDPNTLVVKGYWGVFSRSNYWKRIVTTETAPE